jgi:cell division protein FtsI (penicillin-binding protein 3)
VLVLLLAFGALVAKLVYVQAVDADRYVAFGESQRVRRIALPAARGNIFDRTGEPLALSATQRTIWVNPRLVTDPLAEAAKLSPLLEKDIPVLQEQMTRDSSFVYLARKIPTQLADRIMALQLDGVFQLDEAKRFLPAGPLASPVIGRVGLDNQGLSGLESRYERQLAGRAGRLVVEQDPSGRDIVGGVRERELSVRGDDLVLTLDKSLQYETERALAASVTQNNAKGGMAIVMDTRTGEVLAMANLTAGEDGEPPRPSDSNRALTAVFEPGSVNKLITVAGALEEGVIGAQQSLAVPGTIRVGNHTFSEHDPHPTVSWSITDIVANSSNVGSIMIGQKLGKDRLDGYLRAFGLGDKTALNFPGESKGLLLDPDKWWTTSMGTTPIGQGLAVTGMQMLAAYNTVANGGTYVAPKLVKAVVGTDGTEHPTPASATRRVISERTAAQLAPMLVEVVKRGTGELAAIDGYTVAGKTGTARKPDEKVRGYKAGAYVASFAGFVPAEQPALSAIVILDEPTPIYGGIVAAPVFSQVAKFGLRELRIAPPGARAVQPPRPRSNACSSAGPAAPASCADDPPA